MIKAFRGKGTVRSALFSSAGTFAARPLKSLGNVSELSYTFALEEAKLLDYRSTSGGIDAGLSRVSDFTGTLALRHMTPENLALALWGGLVTKPSATLTDEAGYTITAGSFIATNSLIDTTQAVTVKKGATTVLASFYKVTSSGLEIADDLAGSGVTSGDAVTVSYKSAASVKVDALLTSAPIVSIQFSGTNEVDGKTVVVRLHKCRLGVPQALQMIGDDFATLQVPFTVESDDTIVGAGLSKYLSIDSQS